MESRSRSPLALSDRLDTAPPIARGSMPPRPWVGFMRGLGTALLNAPRSLFNPAERAVDEPGWLAAARRRRLTLLAMVAASTALATYAFSGGRDPWQTAFFGLLFAWVSAGFFTALMGAIVLVRGDRFTPDPTSVRDHALSRSARTALIMPICNEDIATVFAGLRSTCASLAATGALPLFDIFILSDTSKPDVQKEEVEAWRKLRASLGDAENGGEGRIFYRWRRRRTKRKAGNVADFCRRWGSNYRYMVVLDADSVMSGECLTTLVKLMEANPKAGILQTAPRAVGHDTLHARAQQFAGRVTGRVFTAGLAYWQLGESHYWGHNAILRVEPFMKHCGLAPLSGRGGLSGEILSHDFVEAALMRRAGYEVWLVPDLEGSYEQQPPNLIDELQRDRRWCQGNLQNARLVAEPGFRPVHRAMFITGAMSYLASPLWLGFVLLGVVGLGALGNFDPANPGASWLWLATLGMLLAPRAFGVAWVLGRREQHQYGGTRRLLTGAAFEAVLAAFQAPIRMIAHTLFVIVALTGLKLDWRSPSRDASSVPWSDAARRFGKVAFFVSAGWAGLAAAHPDVALQVAPLTAPLLLAVPLAVWTSRTTLGESLRRRGLLLIPEETTAPALLRRAWDDARSWSTAVVEAPREAVAVPKRAAPRRVHASRVLRLVTASAAAMLPVATPLTTSSSLSVAGVSPHVWIALAPSVGESLSSLPSVNVMALGEELTIGATTPLGPLRPSTTAKAKTRSPHTGRSLKS